MTDLTFDVHLLAAACVEPQMLRVESEGSVYHFYGRGMDTVW